MLYVIAGLLVMIVCVLGGGRIFAVLAGLIVFPAIIYSFAQMSLGEWAFVGGGTILVFILIAVVASARNQTQGKPQEPVVPPEARKPHPIYQSRPRRRT